MLKDFRTRLMEIVQTHFLNIRGMEQSTRMGDGRFGKYLSDPGRNLQVDALCNAVHHWGRGTNEERDAAREIVSYLANLCGCVVERVDFDPDGCLGDDIARVCEVGHDLALLSMDPRRSDSELEAIKRRASDTYWALTAELNAMEQKQKIAGRVASAA